MPPCFIRADIAHLIKTIVKWDCFKKYDVTVKDFYVRLIDYLSKATNYKKFIEVIMDIFIVCQSPKTAEGSKISNSSDNLINCIKFHPAEEYCCDEGCTCDICDNLILESLEVNNQSNAKKTKDTVLDDIKNIKVSALSFACKDKNLPDNLYFRPELAKNIAVLFSEYPVWTNIMMEKFNTDIDVATSGRSEALFADLRHVSNFHRPITCQLFLSQYVNDYVIRAIITAMGLLKSDTLNSPIFNVKESKEKNAIKKTRGLYLESFLDIEERHNRPYFKKINMLVNANLESPIEYNANIYEFETSCMFDSIFELCASSYIYFNVYKITSFETCKNHFCFTKTTIITWKHQTNVSYD